MKIKIYSTSKCPYCVRAIEAATKIAEKDSRVQVIVLKRYEDFDDSTMRMIFPDAKTYPQIIIDGHKIGGWAEFQEEMRISK